MGKSPCLSDRGVKEAEFAPSFRESGRVFVSSIMTNASAMTALKSLTATNKARREQYLAHWILQMAKIHFKR